MFVLLYFFFCSLHCLSFWLPLWYLLITTMVSSDYHYGIFWLPLWYLLTFLTRILPSLSTIRGVHVTQSMFSVLWNIAQNIVFVLFFGHLMNWLTLWNLQTICVQYTNFTTDAMHQAGESYYLGAPGLTPVLSVFCYDCYFFMFLWCCVVYVNNHVFVMFPPWSIYFVHCLTERLPDRFCNIQH